MTRSSKAFTSCCATTTPILRLPVCVVVTNLVFALVLLAAGCSSSGDGSTAEAVISTTASTEAPTTTQATTVETSDPEPSVTTEPAAEWTPEELEIIDAYEMFQTQLAEILADDDLDPLLLRPYTSASLSAALVELVNERRADGVGSRGSIDIRPMAVEFESEQTGLITVCRWGRTERLEDGVVVVPADPEPIVAVSQFMFEDGRWRIDGAADDERAGDPCEL